jgi:hypothetical protein
VVTTMIHWRSTKDRVMRKRGGHAMEPPAGRRQAGGRAGTAAGCNKEACPIETGHPVGTVKPADG